MYQFHTGLLGTIRASRTRCTTQSAIMCYQLLGFHHKELVNGVRTHLIECMPTSTFTAHLIQYFLIVFPICQPLSSNQRSGQTSPLSEKESNLYTLSAFHRPSDNI